VFIKDKVRLLTMSEQTTQAISTSKRPKVSKYGSMRKPLIGMVLLVVIVVGVAGTAWLVVRHRHHHSIISLATSSGLGNTIDDAQQQAAAGNSNGAQKILRDAINNTTDITQKRNLYVQQGITYANQQQYPQAMTSYKQAEQLGITYTIAQLIAQTAQAEGDNQLAITYYRKAITLLDPRNPVSGSDKQSFQAIIQSLGGQ